ncbi:MAG: hypothetical protein A4E42_00272 [Methanoregulaceae archaeon PtaU1.Bin222]|nr:MAG: hypothetical protein A4E42_00272 [Methanoregulaceae archaeon PtaU1.Bin222]
MYTRSAGHERDFKDEPGNFPDHRGDHLCDCADHHLQPQKRDLRYLPLLLHHPGHPDRILQSQARRLFHDCSWLDLSLPCVPLRPLRYKALRDQQRLVLHLHHARRGDLCIFKRDCKRAEIPRYLPQLAGRYLHLQAGGPVDQGSQYPGGFPPWIHSRRDAESSHRRYHTRHRRDEWILPEARERGQDKRCRSHPAEEGWQQGMGPDHRVPDLGGPGDLLGR